MWSASLEVVLGQLDCVVVHGKGLIVPGGVDGGDNTALTSVVTLFSLP